VFFGFKPPFSQAKMAFIGVIGRVGGIKEGWGGQVFNLDVYETAKYKT
jgi:hypothetical protein